MVLRDYWTLTLRYWWILLASVLLCLGAAAAPPILKAPQYNASASFAVTVSAPEATVEQLSWAHSLGYALASDLAELAPSSSVLVPAADTVGEGATESSLKRTLQASSIADSSVVRVSATAPSGERAAIVANAVSNQLQLVAQDVANSLVDSEDPDVSVNIVAETTAAPSSAPIPRGLPKKVLLGGGAGLVLGYITLVTVHRSRGRYDLDSDLNRFQLAPVLNGAESSDAGATIPVKLNTDHAQIALISRKIVDLAAAQQVVVLFCPAPATQFELLQTRLDDSIQTALTDYDRGSPSRKSHAIHQRIIWCASLENLSSIQSDNLHKQLDIIFFVAKNQDLREIKRARKFVDGSFFSYRGVVTFTA